MDEDALDRAWGEVVAGWDDDAVHQRFVALGDATDRLPDVARRYREVKEVDDPRRQTAERHLEAITLRALSRLSATPRPTEVPRKSRLEWIALGLSVALAAAALWQMLRVM